MVPVLIIRADYQCLKCDHRWHTMVAGGVIYPGKPLDHPHSDKCPECESLYFKWLNYQDFV